MLAGGRTGQESNSSFLHCRKETAVFGQRTQEAVFDLIRCELHAMRLKNVVHADSSERGYRQYAAVPPHSPETYSSSLLKLLYNGSSISTSIISSGQVDRKAVPDTDLFCISELDTLSELCALRLPRVERKARRAVDLKRSRVVRSCGVCVIAYAD